MTNSYLSHAISELKISGGGLRKFIDARWTSAYECTSSVCRLERAFIKVHTFINSLIKYKYIIINIIIYRL